MKTFVDQQIHYYSQQNERSMLRADLLSDDALD